MTGCMDVQGEKLKRKGKDLQENWWESEGTKKTAETARNKGPFVAINDE